MILLLMLHCCIVICVLNLANEDENNSYSIYLPHDILKIPNCNYIQGLLVVVLRQLFIKKMYWE